jgi:hypothetical protein
MQRVAMHRAGGAAMLTAVLLACAGPAVGPTASPSSNPSANAAPSASPANTNALPTLRPTAAPPSSPPTEPPASPSEAWPSVPSAPLVDPSGTLLLMHVAWSDTGGPTALLVVLADGRVVAPRQTADGGGALLQRSLTQAGLERVRAQLVGVGLFDHDRTRQLVKPLNCCGAGDQLRVRLGDETVRVGRLLAPSENYTPSAAWDRFDALVEVLTDVDTWLPDDAWADAEWSPYHAPRFCLALTKGSPGGPGLDADAVTWPDGIRPFASFGEEGWSSDMRVGIVDASTAYDLAGAIVEPANAASIPNDGWYRVPLELGGRFEFPTIYSGAADWMVSLAPLLPRWMECTGM